MRSATKIAALALLLISLPGCGHQAPRFAAVPAEQAPSLPPSQMAALIPPTPVNLPTITERPVKLDTALPPETATVTAPARPRHAMRHHPKSAPQEAPPQEAPKTAAAPTPAPTQAQAAPSEPQVASAQQPSEESPIGQLSTANDSANTADRRDLTNQINAIETGLNAIHRTLNAEEQKTAAQVKTFITRARDALKADDLDGARTLSTKAHLLLEELTKE